MKNLEIILTCVAGIFAILMAYKWKDLPVYGRIGFIIGILALLVVAYNSYKQNKKDSLLEDIEAKIGEIKYKKDVSFPMVRIGNSEVYIIEEEGNPTGLINLGPYLQKPQFTLMVKNGKLMVYAIINDKLGKPIAVIDENIWTLYNDDFEYNNDDTGFELVTKGERMVFFQVYLENGVACIAGNLIAKNGEGIRLDIDPSEERAILLRLESGDPDEYYESYTQKIFKYPRGKFLGVRDND